MLPIELIWYVEVPQASSQTSSWRLYRVPSWSWASLDVLVSNHYVGLASNREYHFEWDITVLSAKADAMLNREVLSAHIEVVALLQQRVGVRTAKPISRPLKKY